MRRRKQMQSRGGSSARVFRGPRGPVTALFETLSGHLLNFLERAKGARSILNGDPEKFSTRCSVNRFYYTIQRRIRDFILFRTHLRTRRRTRDRTQLDVESIGKRRPGRAMRDPVKRPVLG